MLNVNSLVKGINSYSRLKKQFDFIFMTLSTCVKSRQLLFS